MEIEGFRYQFNGVGAGDFRVDHCYCHDGEYFDFGLINGDTYIITNNRLENFSGALILESTSTINHYALFANNYVKNVQRYVYRRRHSSSPLYFENNTIRDVNARSYTGSASVARIVMRGGSVNYIRGNDIRDVVSDTADCVLVYWTEDSLIITDNTFGRFFSGDDCYLVKQKSTLVGSAKINNNLFLGGDDTAEFDGVFYTLGAPAELPPCEMRVNTFSHLKGVLFTIFRDNASNNKSCPVTIADNYIRKFDGASFTGSIQGSSNVTIKNNRCDNHSNPLGATIYGSGSFRAKCIVSMHVTSVWGSTSGLAVEGNEWVFTNDGESVTSKGHLLVWSSAGTPTDTVSEARTRSNTLTNASSIIALASGSGS